jgi:acetoacetyl-CoA synthetase
MSSGIVPGERFDLSKLRTIGSTGSPLPPEAYHWVYQNVSSSVFLRSTSGGTDVCTSILGCAPILPTRAGELQCLPLGVAAQIYDEHGAPVNGTAGELVVTEPMPTMPVGLWGDSDKSRLEQTYFSYFPGVWRHGDWVTIFKDGAAIVHGRSDATLNRGGIRIGTAELYEILETSPWIHDSVVIDVPITGAATSTMVLLISVTKGTDFQEENVSLLRKQIAADLSPRHVPDRIIEVTSLPHTINGKRLEVPIKNVLSGRQVLEVVAPGAVGNIDALFEIERRRSEILGVPLEVADPPDTTTSAPPK